MIECILSDNNNKCSNNSSSDNNNDVQINILILNDEMAIGVETILISGITV